MHTLAPVFFYVTGKFPIIFYAEYLIIISSTPSLSCNLPCFTRSSISAHSFNISLTVSVVKYFACERYLPATNGATFIAEAISLLESPLAAAPLPAIFLTALL